MLAFCLFTSFVCNPQDYFPVFRGCTLFDTSYICGMFCTRPTSALQQIWWATQVLTQHYKGWQNVRVRIWLLFRSCFATWSSSCSSWLEWQLNMYGYVVTWWPDECFFFFLSYSWAKMRYRNVTRSRVGRLPKTLWLLFKHDVDM